ncbi:MULTISPECIES: patatin-like protein [unclassified Iodidimonas]|uniref:patatin-like protein n=1 Tax=unclassified Iodidimonas TaxID=2626145 RepID=UPI0024828F58|nr:MULTISPECIES: patatin-like protein [unclassified Iodidimonas]
MLHISPVYDQKSFDVMDDRFHPYDERVSMKRQALHHRVRNIMSDTNDPQDQQRAAPETNAMNEANVTGAPHERELRLALVCYGGVSLAVYMHGITKEILKLVRASRASHDARTLSVGGECSYEDATPGIRDETDSERIYYECLCGISLDVDLRVVVDVLAGASAGGINAVMLARALAYDLSLDPHRDLWLNLADVTELLDPMGRAGLWSKPYMRPFLWTLGQWRKKRAEELGALGQDPEVTEKISLFTRSRWFEPPFSGVRMSQMMLDAVVAMGRSDGGPQSLLPRGQALDLFVTTTDFWGHREAITLHDPPLIEEREHRHTLRFSYVRQADGTVISDMGMDDRASLAFAARATSCFPGAFPPARLAEMDAVAKDRKISWIGRAAFLEQNFSDLIDAGEDPEDAAFIDGSVLMNKPISLAIEAVQSRAAHREVDRRLVYIEPNPEVRRSFAREIPGFFKTIKAAMSDIPRNQPIRDDLEWLAEFNRHVRLQRQVVEAVRPNVMRMITELMGERLDAAPDVGRLITWRGTANECAARDASYAYDGYARVKVLSVLSDVAQKLQYCARLRDRMLSEAMIDEWAWRTGVRPVGNASQQSQNSDGVIWIRFLRRFDVRYRIRRMRFMIRRVNELYRELLRDDGACDPRLARAWLNSLKASLYRQVDEIRSRDQWPRCDAATNGPATDQAAIDALMEQMAAQMNLPAADIDLDQLLAQAGTHCPDAYLWRELVIAYLGFAYYDVLTFPMSHWKSLDELDDIKVDRISVNDANSLRKGSSREILKGVELGNFGAFFSRKFRENDYLWGRLTGAERLVDILATAAPEAVQSGNFNIMETKKRLFLSILDAEAPHLTLIRDEIKSLRLDAQKM